MRKGIKNICAYMEKVKPDTSFPIYVMYSHDRKNSDILADALRGAGYDIPDSNLVNIGGTIGAHVGVGACGAIYVAQK